MLSDVHENVLAQLLRTETTESIPEDAIYMATDILGESTKDAYAAAPAFWPTSPAWPVPGKSMRWNKIR